MYLKNLRKSLGLRQDYVAKELGINKDTLRKLEKNGTELKVDWIPIMSKLYKVDEHEIMDNYLKEKKEVYNDSN